MAIDNLHAEMCYLLDPAFQIESVNGKPLIGGHLEVFLAGTDAKYITYQDWDGNENPFKIPLKSDGRAVVLADPSFTYDIYAYDSYNNLAFSRLNVQCNIGGDISITGKETVIYNTDGTLDVTLQNIENNTNRYIINSHHKEFGVKDPYLYFETDTPEATIIAFSADTTQTDLVSAIGGKGLYASDINPNAPALDDCATKEDLDKKQDKLIPGNGIDITNNVISVTAGQGHTYSGLGIIDVDNVNDTISADISDLASKDDLDLLEDRVIILEEDVLKSKTEVLAGNNISVSESIADDGHIKYTVSGKDWTKEIGAKLDTTAFSIVSGNFLTAHQSLDGLMSANKIEYDTNGNISGYNGSALAGKEYEGIAPIYVNGNKISADLSDYATTASITGKQDELTPGDGIKIENNIISVTTTGLDYVHRDDTLSGNGTVNSPLGVSPLTELAVDDTLTAYDVDDKLVLGVNSEFMTAGLMQESKLEYNASNQISGYDGSAFAGQGGSGGKTYEGVAPIVVNNDENKISANCAEVEYQQIVHDDSLVHVSNNAQYAIGVNTNMFKDETVLWEGNIGTGDTATLSESIDNFERVKIKYAFGLYQEIDASRITTDGFSIGCNYQYSTETNQFTMYTTRLTTNSDKTTITNEKSTQKYITSKNTVAGVADPNIPIYKIIGIGRKSGV